MKNSKGSITVTFAIILMAALILLSVVTQYSYINFEIKKKEAELYIEIDEALSRYNRELFNKAGILAVEGEGEKFTGSLSDSDILEKSVLEIMKERHLVGGVSKAEEIANDFIQNSLEVELNLFDVGELNYQIGLIKSGQIDKVDIDQLIANLISAEAYLELKGINFDELLTLLKKGEFEKIKNLDIYFSISTEIRDTYYRYFEALDKYNISNLYDHYALADYAVNYMGYSITKSDNSGYTSEYILTGFNDKSLQQLVIGSEIFALRLIVNLAEIFVNEKVRSKVEFASFHNPKLFVAEAILLAISESGFDTYDIFHRKKVPFYKGDESFQSFKLGFYKYEKGFVYPDYLKLLLCFVSKRTFMNRLKVCISNKFNIDLDNYYTGIKLKRKIEIKGSIIPLIFKRTIEGELRYVE
ncbi:MAG: hypothetical protein CSB16_01790 [Clostridiales bacterium]|nr:MAG: hypothetical protein CSB16_01790 [Clostridiales bacterium]